MLATRLQQFQRARPGLQHDRVRQVIQSHLKPVGCVAAGDTPGTAPAIFQIPSKTFNSVTTFPVPARMPPTARERKPHASGTSPFPPRRGLTRMELSLGMKLADQRPSERGKPREGIERPGARTRALRAGGSDGDRSLDRRMRVVAFEGKILVAEGEQIGHLGIEAHDR
jgi:hypothetical protein